MGGARLAFAVLWVGLQITLVLTASRRADAAFGFRMFSESSTLRVSLAREVAGTDGRWTRVHVDDGTWVARDARGVPHRFAWSDRVRRPELSAFDVEIPASLGARAQVARFKAALDDVTSHLELDAETHRLLLDIDVRRNGRETSVVHLTGPERAVPSPDAGGDGARPRPNQGP